MATDTEEQTDFADGAPAPQKPAAQTGGPSSSAGQGGSPGAVWMVTVDSKDVTDQNLPQIQTGDRVEFFGQRLGQYDHVRVIRKRDGQAWEYKLSASDGGKNVFFAFPDLGKEAFEVQFHLVGTRNLKISPLRLMKLFSFTEHRETEEEKEAKKEAEKKQKEAEKEQQLKNARAFNPTSMLVDSAGSAMSGVVGAVVSSAVPGNDDKKNKSNAGLAAKPDSSVKKASLSGDGGDRSGFAQGLPLTRNSPSASVDDSDSSVPEETNALSKEDQYYSQQLPEVSAPFRAAPEITSTVPVSSVETIPKETVSAGAERNEPSAGVSEKPPQQVAGKSGAVLKDSGSESPQKNILKAKTPSDVTISQSRESRKEQEREAYEIRNNVSTPSAFQSQVPGQVFAGQADVLPVSDAGSVSENTAPENKSAEPARANIKTSTGQTGSEDRSRHIGPQKNRVGGVRTASASSAGIISDSSQPQGLNIPQARDSNIENAGTSSPANQAPPMGATESGGQVVSGQSSQSQGRNPPVSAKKEVGGFREPVHKKIDSLFASASASSSPETEGFPPAKSDFVPADQGVSTPDNTDMARTSAASPPGSFAVSKNPVSENFPVADGGEINSSSQSPLNRIFGITIPSGGLETAEKSAVNETGPSIRGASPSGAADQSSRESKAAVDVFGKSSRISGSVVMPQVSEKAEVETEVKTDTSGTVHAKKPERITIQADGTVRGSASAEISAGGRLSRTARISGTEAVDAQITQTAQGSIGANGSVNVQTAINGSQTVQGRPEAAGVRIEVQSNSPDRTETSKIQASQTVNGTVSENIRQPDKSDTEGRVTGQATLSATEKMNGARRVSGTVSKEEEKSTHPQGGLSDEAAKEEYTERITAQLSRQDGFASSLRQEEDAAGSQKPPGGSALEGQSLQTGVVARAENKNVQTTGTEAISLEEDGAGAAIGQSFGTKTSGQSGKEAAGDSASSAPQADAQKTSIEVEVEGPTSGPAPLAQASIQARLKGKLSAIPRNVGEAAKKPSAYKSLVDGLKKADTKLEQVLKTQIKLAEKRQPAVIPKGRGAQMTDDSKRRLADAAQSPDSHLGDASSGQAVPETSDAAPPPAEQKSSPAITTSPASPPVSQESPADTPPQTTAMGRRVISRRVPWEFMELKEDDGIAQVMLTRRLVKSVNTYLNALVFEFGVLPVWAATIPSFGFAALGGALLGDLILVFKNPIIKWAITTVLRRLPGPQKIKKLVGDKAYLVAREIRFNAAVKINIFLMHLVGIGLPLFLGLVIIMAYCNLSGVLGVVTRGAATLAGAPDFCQSFASSSFGNFMGAPVGTVGSFKCSGQTCTNQWDDRIKTYSTQAGIDACALKTIVQKESGGNPNAVGHDSHSKSTDPEQLSSPPLYGLNWNYSHGIGLTQWTIFPQRAGNTWKDSGTPSRLLSGKWYTVQDFLNPDLSLNLTAQTIAKNLQSNGNNLQKAFGDYNGSGENGDYAKDSMRLYAICKGM